MKPVTQINFVSIKPGKIDELIEAQRGYASAKLPPGVIGTRMYRSLDGKSVVRVSQYESIEAHKEVHQDETLRQHIDRLSPLVESSGPALYEEVSTAGDFNSPKLFPGHVRRTCSTSLTWNKKQKGSPVSRLPQACPRTGNQGKITRNCTKEFGLHRTTFSSSYQEMHGGSHEH